MSFIFLAASVSIAVDVECTTEHPSHGVGRTTVFENVCTSGWLKGTETPHSRAGK